MTLARRAGAAGLAAVTALAAGCSSGSNEGDNAKRFPGEQKKVAQVVDDLQAAARAGDTNRICRAIFAPQLAASLAAGARTTCQAKVAKELPRDETIKITQLLVTAPTAIATVSDRTGKSTHLTLVKAGATWHVNAIQ